MKYVVKTRETMPADELVHEAFGLIELIEGSIELCPAVQIGDGDRKGLPLELIGEELRTEFHFVKLDEFKVTFR